MNTEMELLKTAVQNAADKGIRFGAPMEAGQLRAWESRHNVTLPEDYFAFLTEAGDGGVIAPITPDCDTLVPFWSYEESGHSFAGVGKPFTLEKSWMPDWGDTIEGAPDDEAKLEKLMDKRWAMIRRDGNITLMEDKTDNFQRWFLVVTGPCRGEVWMESEFGVLRYPGCTFSNWLRLLLEGKWDAYAAERAKEEEKERESRTTPQERCLEYLNSRKYRPKPTACMSEVRAFEAEHGIVLPPDYIEFVTTVANGSRPSRNYFPKLYTMQEDGRWGNLDRPFCFQTMEQLEKVIIKQDGRFHPHAIHLRWSTMEEYLDKRVPAENSPWVPPMLERINGCLPLWLSVRSQSRKTAFLILNGEFRGQIWSVSLQNGLNPYIDHRTSNGDRVNVMNFLEKIAIGAY